jgi:hypothetical protein
MPDALTEAEEDAIVDAASRKLADALYRAVLAGGGSEDDALSAAADALGKLRREWQDVKREDG